LRLIHDPNGAEDVLQEVFIAIWKGASSFRGQACVKTWIYRIAYKRAISWVRNHRFIFRYEEKDLPAEIIEYDEISMDHWLYGQMIDALNQLSIKHRAVLELAYTHGLSYREIAAALECPIGTVKSRMCYALRSLSGKIKGMG
jgi:RNA polymerase sigma-70 factor, ECF subfamily